MLDIQSPTAEIRRDKKEEEEETTGLKYNGLPACPIPEGGHKNSNVFGRPGGR